MKILIYDVDCSSSGVDYPLQRAFEDLGHTADMFDWTKYLFTKNKVSLPNRIKNKVFSFYVVMQINKELSKIIRSKKYDLLLVLRGEHILPETLYLAKKHIPVVANWNTDDLFNKLNSSERLIESIPLYDVHFTPRPNLKEHYNSYGAKNFLKLNWYYRYGLDYNFNLNDIKYDSSFIGSMSLRRLHFVEILLNENLNLYGWGWNRKKTLINNSNWSINPAIDIISMHQIFSQSKINLNILTIENRDSTNFRNFEICAAGGFQLTERSNELLELFDEDKDLVCFSSPEELKSKYTYYLKNNTIREKIALAGKNKIFNGTNSLSYRLNEIINHIKLL